MNKKQIAKFLLAIILGLTTAHLWKIGEETIAIFLIATMLFEIYFITAEKKN